MNDDLEIARNMLCGAWTPPHPRTPARAAVAPASFREIDGRELARQYAAHRTIAVTAEPGSPSRDDGPAAQDKAGGRLLGWALRLRARSAEG